MTEAQADPMFWEERHKRIVEIKELGVRANHIADGIGMTYEMSDLLRCCSQRLYGIAASLEEVTPDANTMRKYNMR